MVEGRAEGQSQDRIPRVRGEGGLGSGCHGPGAVLPALSSTQTVLVGAAFQSWLSPPVLGK